jgi:hypothetical protein
MMRVDVLAVASSAVLFSFAACSDSAGSNATSSGGGVVTDGGDEGATFNSGVELQVPVPATGRVYVKLDPPAVVTPGDPKTDKGWDIAFEGVDAYTNSGVSGSGSLQAFGPLDASVFLGDQAPQTPFLIQDKTGGAFLRWYFYDNTNHVLDSRFHVFGVKDGTKTWKVQILGYYGDRNGAPVSALYRVRWAEVTAGGIGPVQDVPGIDGTAGGPSAPPASPSTCVDLGTAAQSQLTVDQAVASSAWHLCFRRENISVNGGQGGPRNVGAVDFEAAKITTETLAQVNGETPDSEKPRFDAVDATPFATGDFRGDGVVSAFTGLWIDKASNPLAPRNAAWFVQVDDTHKYLLGFERFDGATATALGTVVMRIKNVK